MARLPPFSMTNLVRLVWTDWPRLRTVVPEMVSTVGRVEPAAGGRTGVPEAFWPGSGFEVTLGSGAESADGGSGLTGELRCSDGSADADEVTRGAEGRGCPVAEPCPNESATIATTSNTPVTVTTILAAIGIVRPDRGGEAAVSMGSASSTADVGGAGCVPGASTWSCQ